MSNRKKRFILLGAAFTALYGLCLLKWYHITIGRFLNLSLALLGLLTLALTLYYIAYRFFWPSLTSTRFHRLLLWLLSTLFLAAAAGVWAYHTSLYTEALMGFYMKIGFLRGFLDSSWWYIPYLNMILTGFLVWIPLLLASLVTAKVKRVPGELKPFRALFRFSYAVFLISFGTYLITTDFFQGLPGLASHIFSGATRNYINHRILNEISFSEDIALFHGFNYRIRFGEQLPYLSQTGFYGTLLKLVQRTTKIEPESFLILTRNFLAFVTAGMFAAVALRLKKIFGFISSFVFYIPVLVTYWIIGPTKVIFITNPLYYLPFLTAFFLYPEVVKKSMRFKRFILYIFIVFCFAFLGGYEYISNIILAAAIPVLFFELLKKTGFKQLMTRCIVICLVGTGAYILIQTLHIAQLSVHFHSVREGVAYIFDRASYRTAGSTDDSYMDLIAIWLPLRMLYFGDQYLLTETVRTFLESISSIGQFHLLFFRTSLVSAVVYGIGKFTSLFPESQAGRTRVLGLMVLSAFAAMVSSWTWFLAKGHMFMHERLNGIIYAIPFAVSFYILLGVLTQVGLDLIAVSFAEERASQG